MPRALVGPWLKLYLDVVERKAHYTDHQFRALIEVYVLAGRAPEWGTLPSRRSLERLEGKAAIAFLFDQGDLIEATSNGVTTVTVVGWATYQAKPTDPTNAERQARFRASQKGSFTPQPITNQGLPRAQKKESNGVTSSSSSNNGRPRARDPLLEAQRRAYVERYGDGERQKA